MNYEFYITPGEYQEAAKNGIDKQTLETRIRSLAWNKEKAITTPPHIKKRLDSKWRQIAEQNGICYSTLRYRSNILGWDIERAATQPLQDRKKQAEKMKKKNRVYPREYLEKAEQNGIPYNTFRKRIKSGWSLEKASTRPVMTPREIGLLTKEKRSLGLRNIFLKNKAKFS
ncbi:MAG: hypothetical protein N4A48_04045 [Tepidibacter sp.]|jgi:hypothetical protein|uniref:hypothetical protein n=1 Tax=Tepidibacter sp. TaxID=2529387 RepID=UPI0025DE9A53|nr:hypothetical protein [Tepidibacter sp.]MCT4507921.1 hypothetical protein [Tepidibacter sp.]